MALTKINRLKGKKEISSVFSRARPVASEHFSLRMIQNPAASSGKFAVMVPAKIMTLASGRNLIRRRTTEVLQSIVREYAIAPGVRAVISVKNSTLPDAEGIKRELLLLMNKSGILTT
jgi:ribonuclease P protein component